MKYYIYCLYDPRDPDHCSYVGKTTNIRQRLYDHLSDGRHKTDKKSNWIRSLVANGLKPEYKIIEEVEQENVNDREIFWISYYRYLNQADKNHLDGGEGFTPESAKKMHEKRAILAGKETTEQKKQRFLSLPENSHRPKDSELANYTIKNNSSYDESFHTIIRNKFPHWFVVDRTIAKKQNLLNMPQKSPRPETYFKHYISENNRCYDNEFTVAIKTKFPHWFYQDKNDEIKKELLNLPPESLRPKT